MKKITPIIFLMCILGTVACGTTAPLATPETVPVTQATPMPGPDSEPAQNPTSEPGVAPLLEAESVIPVPSGLQVVYIREGNLWSWTEAGGNVQLTTTGDMSTARISNDGQLLAFMRGREVWKVRMDGMDARLLSTQTNEGGSLWFSPDGGSLAVSTKDHIDVITLADASITTVMTFPALPDGYFPEVIWTSNAMGFKTVIPPQTETGQAELLFVFPDGTLASLAKFGMVPTSESLPYISPDGGYIIYVVKSSDGKEALYLMDSSGATRPYSEPADNVRTYGWLPDAKRFVYGVGELQQTFIGQVDGPSAYNATKISGLVRWIENEHYLTIQDNSLILGNLRGGSVLIDSGVTEFDISQVN